MLAAHKYAYIHTEHELAGVMFMLLQFSFVHYNVVK